MVAINIWTIIISMAVSVVLGMIWYGPLFGKTWIRLAGIVVPAEKPCFRDMMKPIIISLVGAFFMALCLTYSIGYAAAFMGRTGISIGIQAAFWNWLGFVVPTQLSFVAWEGKPWKLFFIHAGYWLILLGIMGIVIAM